MTRSSRREVGAVRSNRRLRSAKWLAPARSPGGVCPRAGYAPDPRKLRRSWWCRTDPVSGECLDAMESFCADHPDHLVCRFDECTTGSGRAGYDLCIATVQRYCRDNPGDPGC